MTLDQLPLIYWVKLGIGLLIFLGPGYLILQSSSWSKKFDLTHSLIASFSISIGFLAVLFEFADPLNLTISKTVIIVLFLFCGLAGLWVGKPWQNHFKTVSKKGDYFRMALWFILIVYFFISLWPIRNEVAGLGSDSYHHTLITQMIIDNGRLPQDFGTFFPIISFTYHFGFHVSAAFLGWVSGIPTTLLILIIGKILIILSSASISLLTEKLTNNKWSGLISAIVVLICIFPSHMLGWGRYTQLSALIITTIFITFFWLWIQNKYDLRAIPLLAFLAAGLGLSHYRVVTMAIVGAITVFVVLELPNFKSFAWKKALYRGGILVGTTLFLAAPWLIHIWSTNQIGYEIISTPFDPSYFTWKRLGDYVFDYSTNIPLVSLLAICMLIGWIKKNPIVIAFTLWFVLLLIPSRHALIIDATSVGISLFVPLAVIVGTIIPLTPYLFKRMSTIHAKWVQIIMVVFSVLLYAGGVLTAILTPVIIDRTLEKSDLKAMEFIQESIPTDAYFMVNLYRFSFSDILMLGSDGGYWIPLLAERKAIAPPMIFTFERVSDPGYADKLRLFESLKGDFVSDSGLKILRNEGITHVYIGARGGPINPADLMSSPDFQLIYQDGAVYIFKLLN